MTKFLPPRKACEYLNVSEKTLRNWDRDGLIITIRTPKNQRRYDIDSVLGGVGSAGEPSRDPYPSRSQTTRVTALYARVSSAKQKEDLQRQIDFLQERYPKGKLYKDIGGGLNFKRKGLLALLEQVMSGNIESIVVGHQDRLARFGVDLIRWFCEQKDCQLVVLSRTELSPERELVEDILSIIHCFSCRLYGLRKYKSTIKEDPSLPRTGTSEDLDLLDSGESVVLQPSD
jgi:putative resolvase